MNASVPSLSRSVGSSAHATELAGVDWIKSRRSQGASNCVELANLPAERVAVRNSRHPDGPALIYPRAEVAALLADAKRGELDRLIT